MILAIVGSQDLTQKQRETASDLIQGLLGIYVDPTVISGGAAGIDNVAEALAKINGVPFEVYRPRNHHWDPDGFKVRNILIAEACDVLWSIRSAQSKTYGSGWTADYAQKIGKYVHRVLLP